MTKRELSVIKQAFMDIDGYEARRLKAFPSKDIINIDEFDKRMLSVADKHSKSKAFSTKKLIAAIIAAALLLSAAISAYALREPIKDFFIERFGTHDHYSYDAVVPSEVKEGIYEPTWIPENYVEIEHSETTTSVFSMWSDGTEMIMLSQDIITTEGVYDTEGIEYEEITIDNIKYRYLYKNGNTTLLWLSEKYSFMLWCTNITKEDALKIATSLKVEKEFPKE